MKTMLHTIASSGFRNVRTVLLLTMLLFAGAAEAAHFRSGTISWRPISGNTVEFKVSQSYGGTTMSGVTLGMVRSYDRLFLGNGINVNIPLTVTSINTAEGWWYGEATFQYTYAAPGNYTAYFGSCCRISNLSNNANGNWRNETIVNVGSGNSSPVLTVAPTVNVPTSLAAAQFQIAAFDPDGDVLSYRLATSTEMGGGSNPTGVSVNSTTGVVSFNTVGRAVGSLWNMAFTISDGVGKTKVTVDFIVRVTQNSTPPVFDYLQTPANGSVIQASPGQAVDFSVKAYDNDQGNIVTLSAVGLPPGASASPSLPTNGNPVTSNFSWTPGANQFGSFVINFTATDNIGVQSTSSVTILISLKPVFNVPPTPAANSETYLETGVAHQSTISVSDPDPNDVVQIMSVTGLPSGATLSTSLPTVAANPSSIQLNWTPTPSNFGIHSVSFIAKDSYNDQTTHSFKYLVNTKPVFTSTPSTSVYVGQSYTYNITGLDPDVAYGDILQLIGGNIPAWLIFTNNGNGTGTLSGTPTLADMGNHPVILKLDDTYHHDYHPNVSQSFTINVSGVAPSIVVPANIVSCDPIVSFAATETVGIPASTITYSIPSGSSFPIGTTTVTATATNAVSTSTKTFTVTVSKPIADIAASGATTFCEGSNVQLSAAPYALGFNGSQHVNVANSFAATDDITIEATVTPTRLADGTFKVIMNHNSWYTGTIHFQFFPDGRLQFAINGANPADQYCTYNFIPNTTYRIAAVYSRFGNYVKFYVNGVLINTGLYFSAVPVVGNAGYSIGSWNGNERFFSGTIDDFRIWNVQRTDAQVLSDAAALPIPAGTPNLVTYYKFNEGAGTTTFNAAGNGNGTLINNPTWVSTAAVGQTYLWSNGAITPSISATVDGAYTVTVTDAAGCFATSAPINVTVNKAPVFTDCPSNQTANNSTGLNTAVVSYTATAIGSPAATLAYIFSGATTGSGVGTGSGESFNIGITTVTITATNSCGSTVCSFTVTVNDITPPTIATLADINTIATSAAGAVVTYTAPVGTDNVIGASTSLTTGLASGATFPIGTTTNTFVVTDVAGNKATSIFTVTVAGVVPVIVNPGTITVNTAAGLCEATVNFAASETTGVPSSTITYSIAPGSLFTVGTTAVTATATNAVGSSSTTFNVTVVDNQAPTVLTKDVTVYLNANGQATITAAQVNNGSTDNCGIATITVSPNNFTCQDLATGSGNGVLAYTAATNNGIQNYTGVLGMDFNVLNPAGIVISQLGAFDHQQNGIFGTQQGGSIRVAIFNRNTQTIVPGLDVYIAGTTDPLVNNHRMRSITPVTLPIGNYSVVALGYNSSELNGNAGFSGYPASNKNTNGGAIEFTGGARAGGTAFDFPLALDAGPDSRYHAGTFTFSTGNQTKTVLLSVTDVHGNIGTATAKVTVLDNIAPVITCADNISVIATSANGAVVNYTQPTATDNCGATVTRTAGLASGSTFPLGVTTVTYLAKDASGNESQCSFTVTVVGVPPVIVAPSNITVNNDAANCGAAVNFTATETTAIPASTITYSHAPGSVFPVGTTTVTATATNAVGTSIGTFTVTVTDNEKPVVITRPVTVTLVNGAASVTAAQVNNGSSDNCGIATMVVSPNNFSCATIGNNTVTLTITDIHGNVQTATAVVTVIGQLPTSSIVSQPTSNVYTGGNANNIYLGYGAQSTVLKVNATGGSSYTYQWIGAATNMLSSATSGMPVFTPTVAGTYTFTVLVTNNFGCTTTSKITICVRDIRVPGAKGKGKVYLCHLPPGNNQNPQTLEISVNAVASHLSGHSGDRLGSCATAACVESAPTVIGTNATSFSKAEEVVADDLKVVVMPNPTSTYFTLKLVSQSNLPVNIKVVDAAGRLVEGKAKQAANSTLQLGHNYATGNYFAEFIQGNQRKVVQLIKIK